MESLRFRDLLATERELLWQRDSILALQTRLSFLFVRLPDAHSTQGKKREAGCPHWSHMASGYIIDSEQAGPRIPLLPPMHMDILGN